MSLFKNVSDPGLGEKFLTRNRRIINKDGSFNVQRIGLDSPVQNLYYWLINMSWTRFLIMGFAVYIALNLIFASLYLLAGVENLQGADGSGLPPFLSTFFFSFETFTTVGYGTMAPYSFWTHVISTVETFMGWTGFALIAGLLYGRFSRPGSKILFSHRALIAPYRDELTSLQFRMANKRHNVLMELEAKVLLMCIDPSGNTSDRKYFTLPLEVSSIHFFPLNWTIVHPIKEESPLYGLSKQDFERLDVEFLIMIKGFDDTFGQIVYTRCSYKWDEVVHGARFRKAYDTDEFGNTIMNVNGIHHYDLIEVEAGRESSPSLTMN
jgi:inward rectifier potassium channel